MNNYKKEMVESYLSKLEEDQNVSLAYAFLLNKNSQARKDFSDFIEKNIGNHPEEIIEKGLKAFNKYQYSEIKTGSIIKKDLPDNKSFSATLTIDHYQIKIKYKSKINTNSYSTKNQLPSYSVELISNPIKTKDFEMARTQNYRFYEIQNISKLINSYDHYLINRIEDYATSQIINHSHAQEALTMVESLSSFFKYSVRGKYIMDFSDCFKDGSLEVFLNNIKEKCELLSLNDIDIKTDHLDNSVSLLQKIKDKKQNHNIKLK